MSFNDVDESQKINDKYSSKIGGQIGCHGNQNQIGCHGKNQRFFSSKFTKINEYL